MKYGKYIYMKPEKLEKTSIWFQRHGKRMLIIAYFDYKIIIILSLSVVVWILLKGKDKFLEARFVSIVVLGGIEGTFPSEQTFISLVIFGLVLFFCLKILQYKLD